jgi:hypothetical protein
MDVRGGIFEDAIEALLQPGIAGGNEKRAIS